ncbi:AIR synthase related protein [Stygiolobus caldivivus]|uniref:AIR synthase n=1 Tax=Stygiolobus caldivivus TaxID=2824673 RepID=A0A8D5U4M5_9CREN|nr:AIR synthase related protein [Stygiolobus caldivivus]BCU69199.1 AIR synthase [Stygiolobus caldivivus]
MDLEGIARKLYPNIDVAKKKIIEELEFYKGKDFELKEEIADAIIEEVNKSIKSSEYNRHLLSFPVTGLKAGEAGLGSRGKGDHIIHEKILELSNLNYFEDARIAKNVVVSVDGIHSRLAYFPYLAGFHATRAAIRDIMVKGANPLGVIVDIHLSDDSDLGMLLDFEGGVLTVTDYLGIPILAGSTLRIGGDLVIGERISGGIGAVGLIDEKSSYLSKENVEENDFIVMTEGNGGGTIATTAIYNGFYDVITETLSLSDLGTCKIIREDDIVKRIHSATDVTNGGIRATAYELPEGLGIQLNAEVYLSLINKKVYEMLLALNIDPLGLSIDSIAIFTKEPDYVISRLKERGIRAEIVGRVVKSRSHKLVDETGKVLEMKFRESPYTPVKKVIGNRTSYSEELIRERLNEALKFVKEKKENVLKTLKVS